MIIRDIEQIKNTKLHDACLLLHYAGYCFERVYIDPLKECSIIFLGNIPEDTVRLFFDALTDMDNYLPNVEIDYSYLGKRTELFTPQFWRYE